jgi:hypothetical protein
MAAYTKNFLIDAYMSRFIFSLVVPIEQLEALEELANKCYDQVGRDQFRVYASLDAQALRDYKKLT